MSNNTEFSSVAIALPHEIKNKGFALTYELFKKCGWHLVKNEMNYILFTSFGNETSYFEIKIDPTSVFVSIPIKNSAFQYKTAFKSYYEASEYIEDRLLDYIH